MKSNVKSGMKSNKAAGKKNLFFAGTWKRNLSVLVSLIILLSSFPLGPILISAAEVADFQVIVRDGKGNSVVGAVVKFTEETTIDKAVVTSITDDSGIATFNAAFNNSLDADLTYEVQINGGTGYDIYNRTGVIVDGVSFEANLVNLYDITTNASSVTGGTITASPLKLAAGSELDIEIAAELGYTIQSVTDNDEPITAVVDGQPTPVDFDGQTTYTTYKYTLTNIQKNHNIKVVFAINTFNISVTAPQNGKITVNGTAEEANPTDTVNYGSNFTFTFTPAQGYFVSGISDNGPLTLLDPDSRIIDNLNGSFTLPLSIAADHIISASFTQLEEGNGSASDFYSMTYTENERKYYRKYNGDGTTTDVRIFDYNSVVKFAPNKTTYNKIGINQEWYPSFSDTVSINDSTLIKRVDVRRNGSFNGYATYLLPVSIQLIIDKTPPEINQITKSPADTWTNGSVIIDITASDKGESGLYAVRYTSDPITRDNDTYLTATGQNANLKNDGKYSFTLTGLSEGKYTYYVWSYDYSGNKSAVQSITVNIDTTTPIVNTIVITHPVINSSGWTNEAITISGTASDIGDSGLSEIRYSNDPDAFTDDILSTPTNTSVVPVNGAYSFIIPNSASFSGTYYVWAYDAAGNKSADFLTQDVNLDIGLPTITAVTQNPDPVSGWTQSAVTITASAADAALPASGIAGIQCSTEIGFTKIIDMTVSTDGLTYTYTTPDSEFEGLYYFRAYDNAGNFSAISSVPVNIDTQNPTISGFDIETSNTSVPDQIINFLTFGVFFNESVDVTVTASDADISSGVSKITLYMLASDGVTETSMDSVSIINNKYKFILKPECTGTLSASATDNSGRNSEKTSPTQVSEIIKSDKLVLSETLPVIQIVPDAPIYTDTDKNMNWYAGDVSFSIQASGDNGLSKVAVRINGAAIAMDKNAKSINTNFSDSKTLSETFVVNTNQGIIGTAGEYIIEVDVTDVLGNISTSCITVYKDVTHPFISGIVFSAVDGIEADGSLVEATDYGYYFLKDTAITILAKDLAPESGVKSITYYTVDYSNSTVGVTSDSKTVDVNNNQISFNVPANFKGQIYAKACDKVNNNSDSYVKPDGTIIESAGKHTETSNITLSVPETIYKDNDGNALFQNNVNISLIAGDNYSGIKQIEWTVAAAYDTVNNQSGKISVDNSGTVTGDISGWTSTQKDMNLITEMSKTITVANNSNAIMINVKLTDRAGNISENSCLVSIDKTAPTLQITYNNNNFDSVFAGETQFYKADRTATIVITERNFDASKVNLAIENTTGIIPVLSGWSEQKNNADPDLTTHTATLLYPADGDYQFDLDVTDRAGLKSADIAAQKFTIDKTIPTIKVSYDNTSAKNGNYYNKERTATITITEHNFETSLITIIGTASNNGSTVAYPKAAAWSTSGDTHTATLKFAADALYSFDISYTDKAGNAAEDFAAQSFYVDLTAPAITITGVKDKSANNGDVIPVIDFTDRNFDKKGVSMTLTGANRGNVTTDGKFSTITNGETFTFDNFKKAVEIDDIYTLTAKIVDTAGNETTKVITFSVNRFGSVYVFDNTLKGIEGKYVQNGIDVVLTETNVDELEAKNTNLKITKNGESRDLVEGTDYTITHTGGNGKWNQYTYVLSASLFSDDGKYIVTLYSRDLAGNINENIDESKKAEIWFGIDKTPPAILATDLNSNSTYALNAKTVTTNVSDNLVLQSVQIFLNGEEIKYTIENDKYTFKIPGSNISQTIKILATDSAGNVSTKEIKNFYVTTNLFVRWFTNIPLLVGSIAAFVLIIGTLVYIIMYPRPRRRTKK